jgi:hypothetical protein
MLWVGEGEQHTVYNYCVSGHYPSFAKRKTFRRLDSVSVFSRLFEIRIKEHNYNLTQSLPEKIKIRSTCIRRSPQNMLERSEGLADWTKHHIQETQEIRPHCSARPSDQSTQLGHLSHLDSDNYRSRSQKTTAPSGVHWVGKLCLCVGTIQRICLSSDDFYSDNTLVLGFMCVELF